ncbi:tetratricopeptide repeat protein 5-like isoform X2 [Chrysoperla carnea]|uniref:tetratricopeptide repeat protein 5-like isoform X2 n=1 Tax=Chrysoperla carnea TaxID=189513 RepID=UPI001D0614AD|nr:tetratricopeptide repeat protein 5-like isoform X2 [Chrysoperla carnea]
MTTNKEELSEDKALPEKEYSLKNLEDCVQKLYDYRDHYFERNTIDDASKRKNDIDIQLKNTLDELDKFQDVIQKEDKPMFYYLKGKSLNVTADFDKNALDLLSKAVKLDPKLVDAWNELGECYWKNDNIKEAKNCFNGALAQRRNKISLRNLSMVYRQECATTKEQQIENIQKGVSYAKEALDLDLNDGNSWAVLGNAHLSNYFLISQNPRTLKMCMSAYNQAKRDIIARNNPDLHYNVGIALKYEEEYLAALNSFSRAQALDPTWDFPKIKEERLLKYLESVNELVATNGRMKGRKLQQLIQSIDNKPSIQDLLTVPLNFH